MMLPQLLISSNGPASGSFRKRSILCFEDAAAYVRSLPYKRNGNKDNLCTVLSDGYGTCSTKHALLRQLAAENGWNDFRLMLCIFRMNAVNTPPVAHTLEKYHLPYMPEAHCYLRINGAIWDGTTASGGAGNFVQELLLEKEIEPEQITDFKVAFHKDFLQQWLAAHTELPNTLDELFRIREQCIKDLEHAS
ncbi:MAG TPA: hypothetical protein VL092_00810 [Chitinophagaceae bacterium]|nr:hypothetical protein [Chitinophagaceae bacterium]